MNFLACIAVVVSVFLQLSGNISQKYNESKVLSDGAIPWISVDNRERSCSLSYYCTGYGSIIGVGEGGTDFATGGWNIPETSIISGVIIGAGYYGGGAVLTVRGYVPYFSADEDVYIQHINYLASWIRLCNANSGCYNQHISSGWVVGYSKPWVEIGVNPEGWCGIWGPCAHPGPWYNPWYSGWLPSLLNSSYNPSTSYADSSADHTYHASDGEVRVYHLKGRYYVFVYRHSKWNVHTRLMIPELSM